MSEPSLSLTPCLHPSMTYPEESGFRFEAKPINIDGSKKICDLIELSEAVFKEASVGMVELHVSIVWNMKSKRRALNPNDEICKHFASGESFGIFGEIKLPDFLCSKRFKVGDIVLCRTKDEKWEAGTVKTLNYRHDTWPKGHTVPYLVEFDDGSTKIVPEDIDYHCVKIVPPWWVSFLANVSKDDAATGDFSLACQDKDVNVRDYKGETALMAATDSNWIAGVQVLLEMKADVNFVDKKERSALHRGSAHGLAMVRLLLEAKASPNHQDIDPDYNPSFSSRTFGDHPEHRTALHYCCLEGDLDSARLLVQSSADMNIQDGQLKTPLHLAIEEDQDALIDFLLQSRAAVDVCSLESGMKNSPLMEAAHSGNHSLAEKLIAARADVNKVGKQDMTALHLAARRGDSKIVKILLEAKADTTLESKCGTALQLASKKGSKEVLQLF